MRTSPSIRNGKDLQTPELWVVIAFLIAPWFLNLATIMIGASEDNIASFSNPTLATIVLSAVHAIFFIILFYLSAILTYKVVGQNGWITSPLVSNVKFTISLELFIVIISGVMIYLLYSALENGIFQTALEYRFNTRKIGFLGYLVLHFLPILVGLRWSERPGKINFILLILLAALNLITGFRILLVYALLMVFMLNYKNFAKNKFWLTSLALLVLIGLVFYSVLRGSVESGSDQSGDYEMAHLIVSNLARSLPITYLDLIYSSRYTSDITTLFNFIFEPFSIILNKLFYFVADQQPVMWNISETLVRPYLIWRGTPTAEPSGFSIHIIPFAYLFYGYIGLAIFAIFFGFLSGLGLHLIRSEYTIKRAFGGVLLCTTIMATESFETMWSLFSNAVMFLTMLALFSRFFFFLFGTLAKTSKVDPISSTVR
jgi:hypothetical protein